MTNLVQFPGLGLSFHLNRVAFTIGGVSIYWYGVCIAVGLCLALVFAFRHSLEFGVDPDSMVDVILIGVVLGIISARAYYVAMAPFKYESIWEMIAIRDGGLAIYGGIIGGFLFGGLACKWRGVPVLPMFDLTAMGFLIGQGCGRWGNFFNQEAFGCNTTLPWGMYSEATRAYLMSSTVTVPKGVVIDPNLPVHPTFLRFKRMQGYEVFQPMGFDAFGLPAENYAIKTGIHPEESTLKNIATMEGQLKRIGAMYDWDYEIKTCMPDYYKWTQWMFLQL